MRYYQASHWYGAPNPDIPRPVTNIDQWLITFFNEQLIMDNQELLSTLHN